MKLLVSPLWLQITSYFLPESIAVAQPFWAWKWRETELPRGAEVLKHYFQGDTLFVYLRIWDFPEEKFIFWGKETLRVQLFFPKLPPDSTMPQADMRVPSSPPTPPPSEEVPAWIGLLLIGVLVGLIALPYLWKKGRRWMYELYLIARWHFWLWRWRRVQPQHLLSFILAVKELLQPHASFHPGSLVPAELRNIHADYRLLSLLSALLQAEIKVSFLGQTLSLQEITHLWQQTHKALRLIGYRLRPGQLRLLRYVG
ncbi:MAG: hypothetical protein NZ580_06845 [Bacteroidia bacterium]|nr:hypothetical protein [Bacteroidia bacterium]MDW8236378.1 hypothetical protein [Bacteroidia bacterium]